MAKLKKNTVFDDL